MTKKIVRIVSAAIVLALGIGLSGCGKKDDTTSSVPFDGAGEGYEFVATSKSINEMLDVSGRLNNVVVENGKVYAAEDRNGKTVFHIADLEGGEDKTYELDLDSLFPSSDNSVNESESEPAETPADTEESSEEGDALAEGTEVIEEGYVTEGEEGGMVYEGGDGDYFYYESSGGSYISDMHPNKDGSVFLSVYSYNNEKSYRAMCKLTADGNFEKMYSYDDVASENEGIGDAIIREDGGIYVGVETRVVYVDNTGKIVGSVESGSWINNLYVDANDNCYATYYGQNGQECKKADFASGQFTDTLEVGGIYGTPILASDGKIVVAGYDSVYEVNAETKEKTKLWDWINLDISNVDTDSFKVNDDGTYSLVTSDYRSEGIRYEYTSISKQEITPETARKDIIYGCTYLDYELRQKISDFNKSQTEYRIRVKTYIEDTGEWNEEEYNNQMARYKADIAAGAIDLMTVESTDYASIQLAKKGAFMDLSDYYASYVNRADYFENILDIFKVNDKDYFAMKDVYLLSMMGNAEIFKGKTSWTPADLVELRKQYPDKEFLEYASQESAAALIIYSLNTFLDYEKGTCDFCRPAFYDLLNVAKTFPKEINYEDYDSYGMMASGDIVAAQLYVSDVRSLSMYRQIMGEDSIIIGPPNDAGIRVNVIPNNLLAVSSKTQYKDGCFQFIKSYVEETDEDHSAGYGMPVLKKAFYDNMKKEITPETYVDENGQTQTVESSYTIGTSTGTIEIRSANQEDVDIIEDLMLNAKDTIRVDEKFEEIFLEEIQPFFEGKKTAEETATVLQSRMKLYLSENE